MFQAEINRIGAGFDRGVQLRPVAGGTHDLGFTLGILHRNHLYLKQQPNFLEAARSIVPR